MNEAVKISGQLVPKPHMVVMFAIFAVAAIAGVFLLPGDAERVAMLERDGDNMRALRMLEQRYEGGDRSQRTLYQLEQLYQHFGLLPKARVMLEKLAESRPRDMVLQRRLVKFYRDTQDGDAYLQGLSRLVSHRYSEPACRELIAQLRLIGRYAREREAIERCRIKGYRRAGDIVRLAELEAAAGNRQRALSLLRNVDDVKGLAQPRERLILASLLIEAATPPAEIAARGVRWVESGEDPRFADELMQFLARHKAHDAAIKIASDAGKPGDALSLSVAELMLDRDQTSAARAYLRGWIENAEITQQDLATRFIDAALDAEDPQVALLAARRFGIEKLPERELVKIAEALGATGSRDEFEIVRVALSSDTLVAHPLLAAMVELNKGATTASRDILSSVSSEELDAWRLALWARLMRETGRGALADARLRSMGAGKRNIAAVSDRTDASDASTVAGGTDRKYRKYRTFRSRAARLRRADRATGYAQSNRVQRVKRASRRFARSKVRSNSGSKVRQVSRKKDGRAKQYLARPNPVVRPLAANEKQ